MPPHRHTPRHTLPVLHQLLRTSRKTYASVGRCVRPHLDGPAAATVSDDRRLGREVATLLAPMVTRRVRGATRRRQLTQQRGGGRPTRKQGVAAAMRAEAAWRERHPELLAATTVGVAVFPWAHLPLRLRVEQDGRLRALKARLVDAATLEHAARAAWVRRLVSVEARGWTTEAASLRARVHA